MMSKQALVALVAVALLMRPISPQAQSLADVARAEAARRSAITQPVKVYTDENLGSHHTQRIDVQNILEAGAFRPAAASARTAVQSPLAAAARVRHDVPVDVVASLTRRAWPAADASPMRENSKYAAENAAPATPAIAIPFIGWNSFTIPKTPEEIAADMRFDGREERLRLANRSRGTLAPRHQVMRSTIGLGYVQGADWATEINSVGKVLGLNADLTSFVTMGRRGLGVRSGRLSLVDPELGWGLEAGQLFTDLRGLATGVRGSWRFKNHQSTVSFYNRDRWHDSTLAYRDEVRLGSRALVGGEISSDGSLFVRARTIFHNLGLDTYYRKQDNDAAQDRGVGLSYDIWRGVTFRTALRTSTSSRPLDSDDWRLLSVRLPLGRGLNLTLERNWLTSDVSDSSGSALQFHVPTGPLQIFQRYQWGELAYKLRDVPFGFNQRQMQTMASYKASRWLTLNYQVSTEWFEDGRAKQWDELMSSFRLARNTSAEVITAMPQVLESSRFRFRFSHQLTNELTLLGEYGRLSAFRPGPEIASERPRFLITVRKTWNTPTPARGGSLVGSVLDSGGEPVPGVVVRLGDYGQVTDQRGNYAFKNLPTGSFDYTIDNETLPADYAYDGGRQAVTMVRRTRATKNLIVVPLRSLTGRVYCDENRNGRLDAGEEIAGAVLRLNARVTASDRTGRYGFYNLSPGEYVIELDRQRLREGLGATKTSIKVQLEPDRAATGLDFILEKVDKPLFLQEWQ